MNVLFIEHDRLSRRVMGDMLKVAGASMTEAESGEQGLALIDAHHFDLVLLDDRTSGVNGLTLIDRVRGRDDDKANVPLVVVTADAATLRGRCLAAGADDVLFRPVAMAALFDVITHVLASRHGNGRMIG